MEVGKQREKINVKKYVGNGNFSVVAINPTREELEEILDKELENEIEYVKTKSDGKTMAIIAFWAEEELTKEKFKIDFILTNENAFSSDKANPKALYINQIGDTQYVDNEDSLFESFKNFTKIVDWKSPAGQISKKYSSGAKPNEVEILGEKEFRQAKVGERELYNFIRNWMSGTDFNEPSTNLFVDFDLLMEGDVSELQGFVGSKIVNSVVGSAIVETDKEDSDVQYQKVSKKAFLPGDYFKYIKLGSIPKRMEKKWNEYCEAINRETKAHSLELIHEYDPEKDLNTSGKTRNSSDDSY